MRSVALGFALALLAALPARAAEPPLEAAPPESPGWNVPTELRDNALTLLFEEIAILVELDAFAGPVPPQLRRVHEAYEPFPSTSRETGMEILDQIDAELQTLKIEMLAFGPSIAPPTGEALEEIEPRYLQQLIEGDNRFLPSLPYMAALGTLLSNGTANQVARPDPGAALAGLDAELEALADRTTFSDELGPSSTANPIDWMFALAVAAGVTATAGVTVVVRRRRGRSRNRSSDLSSLTRLLLAAATEKEVETVAVAEAVQRTSAEDGVLVRSLDAGVRRAGSPAALEGTLLIKVARKAQLCRR